MLIQANYQQVRVKNNSAKAIESNNNENNNNDTTDKDKSDDDSASNTENSSNEINATATAAAAVAEAKTSENEANATADDVSTDIEMADVPGAIPTIKTEPAEENPANNISSSEPMIDDNTEKMDVDGDKSESCVRVIKSEVEETDTANSNNQSDEQNNVSHEDGATNSEDGSVNAEEASTNDSDDPYSKDIDIDPRTYCKLGHFHLLLEDYPKGESKNLVF